MKATKMMKTLLLTLGMTLMTSVTAFAAIDESPRQVDEAVSVGSKATEVSITAIEETAVEVELKPIDGNAAGNESDTIYRITDVPVEKSLENVKTEEASLPGNTEDDVIFRTTAVEENNEPINAPQGNDEDLMYTTTVALESNKAQNTSPILPIAGAIGGIILLGGGMLVVKRAKVATKA